MQPVNPGIGTLLAVLAGLLLGSFALPMKRMRDWQWENTWFAYCMWSLIVFTWGLAFTTVPGLIPVLLTVPVRAFVPVFLFGAGWGIGCVLFGLALDKSGLALGTAIVLGLNNALGALLPLILFHADQLAARTGRMLVAGVTTMIVGVTLCAWAGSTRKGSLEQTGNSMSAGEKAQIRKGIFLAIAAGIFATMFNFALVFAGPIQNLVGRAGAQQIYVNNAVWCVSLLGGFIVNAGYCGYLLTRNRTWSLFTAPHSVHNWSLSIIMGGTWMGGVALYGMAVSKLGRLGPSIGWALIQTTAIMAGNLLGLLTGEWRNSGHRFRAGMASGLAVLFGGITVVAASALV
jgi:L-rhamnose-H+ transport protein